MTSLSDILTLDLWSILAPMLDIRDTCAVVCTCHEWRRVFLQPHIDRLVAHSYATSLRKMAPTNRGGRTIMRSLRRTRAVAFATLRQEIRRIEELRRTGGRARLAQCELYDLWGEVEA